MKKLQINSQEHLNESIAKLKEQGYGYFIGPSLNVRWMLIDDSRKEIRFEYGEDAYPNHELIESIEDEKPVLMFIPDKEYWIRRCKLVESVMQASIDSSSLENVTEAHNAYSSFLSKYGKKE